MIIKNENLKIKEYKMNQYNLINGSLINESPKFFSKKLRKCSKLMTHLSDKSTLNTISNISTENNCNGNSNTDEKINNRNAENIGIKINHAFEALEKLILEDNDNNKTKNINDNSSPSVSNEEDKIKIKTKKISHTITIPKLDFSDIFDYYQNTPVYIKQIKIMKSKDKHNEKGNEKQKKHHHHKHNSHNTLKKYNIEYK